MEKLLHIVSLTLALAAAAEAVKLIRLTGHAHAWLFLALGFVLLAAERALELFSGQVLIAGYSLHESISDVLMLVMTAFYLLGIHQMHRVFLEHRTTRDALQHELDDLRRFQHLTVGRELRMKALTEENSQLRRHLPDTTERSSI